MTEPYRSGEHGGRDGFIQLVRAEFTKLRTVGAWLTTLGVAGVLIVVMALVVTPHQPKRGCITGPTSPPTCIPAPVAGGSSVPVGPGGEPVVDSFSFAHQPMIGNGTLTARVTTLTSGTASPTRVPLPQGGADPSSTQPEQAPWAKAGLMITVSTNQGSPYAAVMVTPGHGARMQYDYTGDVAGLPGAATSSSPRWLRLTRVGDLVTGYDSLDGTHWTKIGTAALGGLPRTVQIGLFTTSPFEYTEGVVTLATASFDRVSSSDFLSRNGWSDRVVGANTQEYATAASGVNWFKHSGGTFIISGSGDIAPLVAGGRLQSLADTRSLMAGGIFGLIAVIVLAALSITAEYRRGLIRTTFTASPRRSRVLVGKAVVIGSVSFVVASIATAIAQAISRHLLAANGSYVFPLSIATEVRVALGTGLLFAVVAIGILALATVLRRSAGAIVAGIVAFTLPFILLSEPFSSGANSLLRFTPVAGFAIQGALPRFAQVAGDYTMGSGYYPLSPWVGLAVLCVWTAVAFGAALWSLGRRDV